eukprot:jgi/Pico_ML_1/53901/g4369.t1
MLFLVVYVGAVAVLFLFVVMMLDVQIAALRENALRYLPVGGVLGLLFLLEVLLVLQEDFIPFLPGPAHPALSTPDWVHWARQVAHQDTLTALGQRLYTVYSPQGLTDLHHDIFFFLLAIVGFVFWMLSRTLWHFHQSRNPQAHKVFHGTTIEVVWTVVPSLVLLVIALPSFALLYSLDEVVDPRVTVKAIGHQWYWTYEYSDYNEGTNRPCSTTATCWAVPSLGVKCDAVPGRLNQVSLFLQREGVFYGQCSEICGVNHGFMPIVVEAVPLTDYVQWIAHKLEEA